MTTDSMERYGRLSRRFHWGMALLVFWQILRVFDRVNDGEHRVGENQMKKDGVLRRMLWSPAR